MTEPVFSSLDECFNTLPEPRVQGRCDHKLNDLIIITMCAVIWGADSWTGVETFAKAKQGWLKCYLDLPNGIPSHNTFGRVFASLNAEAFQSGFSRCGGATLEQIALILGHSSLGVTKRYLGIVLNLQNAATDRIPLKLTTRPPCVPETCA